MVVPDEAVILPDADDISEVIAAAVGADFGGDRIKEVDEENDGKWK